MITPIETIYKGWRFRSRLEARWAVFFETMGIEWEYEPETFWLPEFDEAYLPDFRILLDGRPVFVEVKPPGGDFTKADHFCSTGEYIIFAEGAPAPKAYRMWMNERRAPRLWFSTDTPYIGKLNGEFGLWVLFGDWPKTTSAVNAARAARFGAYE